MRTVLRIVSKRPRCGNISTKQKCLWGGNGTEQKSKRMGEIGSFLDLCCARCTPFSWDWMLRNISI